MWAHSRPISSSTMRAGIGERNEAPSICMTASRSPSFIGSTSIDCGSLLTAIGRIFPASTLNAPTRLRNFAARRAGGAPRGVEDRPPERVDPFARLARDEQRSGPAATPAKQGAGALPQHAALGRRQLVDLREHDLGGNAFGPEPLVEL